MICLGQKFSAWSCLLAQVWQESIVFPRFLYSCRFSLCCSFRRCCNRAGEQFPAPARKHVELLFFSWTVTPASPLVSTTSWGLVSAFLWTSVKAFLVCFVCGAMIKFRKQLLRFRATWALPTNTAGCQMTKIFSSVTSRESYGQKWHCNTYNAFLCSERLRCALVNKLNHGIRARSWISISKFHISKRLDGKGMFMKPSFSGKHGLLIINMTSGLF